MKRGWIVRIIDGDTLEAWVEHRPGLHERIRVRLAGIDAPEMKGPEKEQGKLSTAWVRQELAGINSVEIELVLQDSFGRWVGNVYYGPERKCLSDELLSLGYAVVYSRGDIDLSIIQTPEW